MVKQSSSRRVTGFALTLFLVLLAGLMGASAHPASAQGVTPSPTVPGQIVLPTATQTAVGGPTATPTRTPTLTPVTAEAFVEANLRSGPGLDFELVGTIRAGEPVPVIGRSVAYPWYVVQWQDGEAWVFEQLVQIVGDITTVPIVDAPELPTANPAQAAEQATAAVLLQTPGAPETATAAALLAPTTVGTLVPGGAAPLPGSLPTFTPPPPLIQQMAFPTQAASEAGGRGFSPAGFMFSLAGMGLLTLLVAAVRRFF